MASNIIQSNTKHSLRSSLPCSASTCHSSFVPLSSQPPHPTELPLILYPHSPPPPPPPPPPPTLLLLPSSVHTSSSLLVAHHLIHQPGQVTTTITTIITITITTKNQLLPRWQPNKSSIKRIILQIVSEMRLTMVTILPVFGYIKNIYWRMKIFNQIVKYGHKF